MSNAQSTYNATMTAARATFAAAVETYNSSEWSIEAQTAYDIASGAFVAAQYAAQTALTMQSAAEQVAAVHAAADAMMTEVNATMTAAHFAYRASEWSIEAQTAFEVAGKTHETAQQAVNAFRNTYGR